MTTPALPRRSPRRVDRRTLRTDLRHLMFDAVLALAVTALLFALLYWRIDTGTSQTLNVMPELDDARVYWLYWACQAFGWSALLWAWISVVFGLARSMVPLRSSPFSHAQVERWHRVTSITTMLLMLAHALAFFAEKVRANDDGLGPVPRFLTALADTFVPGHYSSGTGEVAILIGLIALYLAIPLGLSFYVRSWTGSRLWRALHRFVIVVYVLSVWHTLLYGTNVWFEGWFRTLVWALQLPIALLFLARLLRPLRREEHPSLWSVAQETRPGVIARSAGRVLTAAGVVVLLLATVTGRDGGRTPDEEVGDMLVTQPMIWGGLAVLLTVMGAVALARWRPLQAPTTPAE